MIEPSGEFWISKDRIIKMSDVFGNMIYGYDILTEEFVGEDIGDCFPITKSILNLMANERARVVLADFYGGDYYEKAKLFGIGVRSWSRRKAEWV